MIDNVSYKSRMVATTLVPAGVPSGAVTVVVVTAGGAPESVRVMT